MRVDLVAAPVRYPRTPLLALLAIAVVPAVGLFVLFQWADERADVYEASRDAVDFSTPPPEEASDVSPALPTAFFDYRRAPDSVADIANANRLDEEMAPVFGFIGEDSCAAVSVGGLDAAAINADEPLIPASTQKLLVAAVALELLGPDHRFTTSVAAPQPVDGVVDGDVYLIGGGDPMLTSDDYPVDDDRYPVLNPTSLDRLADAFVAAGIERITGTVIGDGTRYDDEWFVESWGPGVAFDSAGPYDALLVNDARVLGRGNVEDDPNEAAAREFVRLLGNRGIRVNNGWGSGTADATAPVIGTVESVSLGAIITELLTASDNNTAEMLLKEIGYADAGEGTRAAGLTAVDRTLRTWGIPMEGVRLVDGSGLSPDNRLTCRTLVELLQHEVDGRLPDALPVAGVSGTLEDEFVESPVRGNMRAKTGTLGNPPDDEDPPAVKALAGYLEADGADPLVFALVLNAPDVDETERYAPLWTAFAERIDTYPSGPSAIELGPR